MEDPIAITKLNDFIFCPASIYFHGLFGDTNDMMYKSEKQLDGTNAHKNIDNGGYPAKDILRGIPVYSEKYGLYGKIDVYNSATSTLTERKKKIVKIYDGYIFQLFAQYFALTEMGYTVNKLELYSMDDNKKYNVELPSDKNPMFIKFTKLIEYIRSFNVESYVQDNVEKCKNCIYSNICDRTLYNSE